MPSTRGASAARQASGSAADAGSVIRSQAWSGSSSAIAFSSTTRSVVYTSDHENIASAGEAKEIK